MLSPTGAVAVAISPLPPAPPLPIGVAIMRLPLPADDVRLRHQTTDRSFLDAARAASGCREVAFVDADGFLTGGSWSTLFVAREDRLLTPPSGRALAPGTLRTALIEEGRAVEQDLRAADLAVGFLIGDAVHGLMAATLHVPE
jgi:para-aminobenzoate synthetase/4-amino-4-deoxychorismate lyase